MDVSIIIVNWNSVRFLRACLSSIQRCTAGLSYEVIVVDSGSFDGCGEFLRAEFAWVRFIQSKRNIGFSRANNLACRAARGRHLLFLNPDTEMSSPAVLLMHQHLERQPRAGAVGVTLFNGDGSVQTSCIQAFPTVIGQLLNSELLRRLLPDSALWGASALYGWSPAPAKVDVVSGACLMVRRSAFDKVGGFSEDYFMYAEDLDLCHRLRRAGYSNYYLPKATVKHFGGGCTDSAPSEFSGVMMRESIWRFLCKSRGSLYGAAYRVSTSLAAVVRLVLLLSVYPFRCLGRAALRHRLSIKKWFAILAWSLKLRRARFPS